jgi:hypothetical protein
MPTRDGGYLMNDNRASGGRLVEMKTFTCAHCNAVVVMHPERTRPREYCRKCDAIVCDKAGCILNCLPMERVLEMAVKFPDEPHLLYGPDNLPLVSRQALDKTKVY